MKQLYLYLGIGAVILFLVAGWTFTAWNSRERQVELEKLTKDMGNLKSQYDGKLKELDNNRKAIDDLKNQVDAFNSNQKNITSGVKTAVDSIMAKYSQKPQTPENLVARTNEISETRIDGLWRQFCAIEPEAAECEAIP